nr:Os01g0737550 [Ipomoea batatas]GMC71556.1 Os01g0737550 [Ipomoea batatas]
MWEVILVEEQKNQAASPDAELERRGGVVLFSFPAARMPLNVDNEILKAMAVVVKGLLNPSINIGSSFGHSDNKFDAVKENNFQRNPLQTHSGKLIGIVNPSGQMPQIHHFPHNQTVISEELFSVILNPHPDEGEEGVGEEVEERIGDEIPVEKLKDEATLANAELESCGGGGGFEIAACVGMPLNVQSHDQIAEVMAVVADGVVDH